MKPEIYDSTLIVLSTEAWDAPEPGRRTSGRRLRGISSLIFASEMLFVYNDKLLRGHIYLH